MTDLTGSAAGGVLSGVLVATGGMDGSIVGVLETGCVASFVLASEPETVSMVADPDPASGDELGVVDAGDVSDCSGLEVDSEDSVDLAPVVDDVPVGDDEDGLVDDPDEDEEDDDEDDESEDEYEEDEEAEDDDSSAAATPCPAATAVTSHAENASPP